MSRRIRTAKYVTAAVAAVLLVCLGGEATATPLSFTQHILVPSYINPGPGWDGIARSSPSVGIALLNVNSGPGTGPDTTFQQQVATEEAASISMYGYVWTNYGKESLATVEAEVSDYASWYGVKNIFFDGVSTDCSLVSSYYQPLYNLVHADNGRVIINPGTSTSQCYMSAADIVTTFEGSDAQYQTYSPPSWTTSYPADDFYNIVYSAPTQSDMTEAVSLSQTENVGWIYVTNLGEPNPYRALPAYWGGEVDTVAGTPLSSLQVGTTSPLAGGYIRLPYAATLAATGGNAPYRWSIASGLLPVGVHMNKVTGKISGRPRALGTSTFTVQVTDAVGDVATRSLSITMSQPAPFIGLVHPSAGTVNGGTRVTITGANFEGATSVRFGGTAERFTVNGSGRKITAYSPVSSAGAVNITVDAPGGSTVRTTADDFTYSSVG